MNYAIDRTEKLLSKQLFPLSSKIPQVYHRAYIDLLQKQETAGPFEIRLARHESMVYYK